MGWEAQLRPAGALGAAVVDGAWHCADEATGMAYQISSNPTAPRHQRRHYSAFGSCANM